MKYKCLFLLLIIARLGWCQAPTEFVDKWNHSVELGSMNQNIWQREYPRTQALNFQYAFYFLLKPSKCRIAPSVGLIYNGPDLDAYGGFRLDFKLYDDNSKTLKELSVYNIFLPVEAYVGTNELKLVGAGIGVEVGKKFLLSFKENFEFESSNWWSTINVGIMLRSQKTSDDEPGT